MRLDHTLNIHSNYHKSVRSDKWRSIERFCAAARQPPEQVPLEVPLEALCRCCHTQARLRPYRSVFAQFGQLFWLVE